MDEGFFSGPGSPPPASSLERHFHHQPPHHVASVAAQRARGKLKPLLKKVSGSRGNSLDLSRSDGGLPNGVGLGIYDSTGYDSSGIEDDSPFANRHRRNFSQTSGSSPLLVGANQTFSHPKRQVPRRGGYTPDVTQYNTSNESSDDSDDDNITSRTRRAVLEGSRIPAGGLKLNTGRGTPMLPTSSLTDLHHRARTPSIQMTTPISPVSPIDLPPTAFPTGLPPPHGLKASFKRRARSSLDKSVSETSPSFEASVTAARLAWEAKEEKKEEKRERKRRRSEAKEEERSRATSRCSGRGRGNSGSSHQPHGSAWAHEEDYDGNSGVVGVIKEKDGEFESEKSYNDHSRGRNATGRKWALPIKSEAPGPVKRKKPSLKKRWLGFVVWVRIGVVRMQRRLGF